ncbi:MAG: SAM-dependent methyltransferase, partial [Parvibaculales bacterium]
ALDWVAPAAYDAVLLDAPCTATGTLRRHPDLLRHRSAAAMAKLMELQAALLARAADWVKPGGLLAYGVCSLQPQEGEAQIDGFLKARDDFTLEETTPPKRFTPDDNMDGFYLALMRKGGDG